VSPTRSGAAEFHEKSSFYTPATLAWRFPRREARENGWHDDCRTST